MTVIELDGVTRRFGDLTAVDQVSLEVHAGEIVGLLGHNGAGKTTLLRVLNGLLPPHEGRVQVHGLDPMVHGHRVRARTGVLTEYPALEAYLSSRENLEVYAAINGVPATTAARRIDALLERLGLADKHREPTRDLSAGLKQRVSLARALVHDPELLLLDEPTTNMDPVAARAVRTLITDAVREQGRTVLLSTHNLAEAEELCDRVAIMRGGRILVQGPPSALRRRLGAASSVRIGVPPGEEHHIAARLGDRWEVWVQAPGDIEVAAHDGKIEVAARDGDAATHHGDPRTNGHAAGLDVAEVVRDLVAVGASVLEVTPREPTLEQVYVALHRTTTEAPTDATAALLTEGSRP